MKSLLKNTIFLTLNAFAYVLTSKSNIKYIAFLVCMFVWANSTAQEFKIAMKGNKVKLHTLVGFVSVETHSGNELIIQAPERVTPEQADGLKAITSGVDDNTKLGLNVSQNGDALEIVSADKNGKEYKILIPEKVALVANLKGWKCKGMKVSNFKAELEISSEYPNVNLHNVTGPVVLNVTYGKVLVTFDNVNQSKPISIVSAYGNVDVALPENTKANLKLQSDYGEIYTDFNIVRDKKVAEEEMEAINSSFVSGTINGGGVEIYIKSPYSNIYLRKKK